nr:hypothetical protein [Dinophyceae sp. MRD-151]
MKKFLSSTYSRDEIENGNLVRGRGLIKAKQKSLEQMLLNVIVSVNFMILVFVLVLGIARFDPNAIIGILRSLVKIVGFNIYDFLKC